MPGMGGPGGMPGYGSEGVEDESTQADNPGFVIVIEGYTPYKDIGELMDPLGVGDDQAKWGFITRLVNLDKVFEDANLELYKRDSVKHFSYETGDVDIDDPKMPAGIGEEKTIVRVKVDQSGNQAARGGVKKTSNQVFEENVLVDPMTNEEISKTYDLGPNGTIQFDKSGNEKFIVRDHWFRIKAKFLWKEAADTEEE